MKLSRETPRLHRVPSRGGGGDGEEDDRVESFTPMTSARIMVLDDQKRRRLVRMRWGFTSLWLERRGLNYLESLYAGLGEKLVKRGDLGARTAPRAVGEHYALLGTCERNEKARRRLHLII